MNNWEKFKEVFGEIDKVIAPPTFWMAEYREPVQYEDMSKYNVMMIQHLGPGLMLV